MKEFGAESIRNIAFIGHGGSGKTSICELLLYTAGETNRIGKIEEGNTISDFTPNEIERQISISSTALHVEWKNSKINFLDTPGYTDFIGHVNASLHVADTVFAIVKGAEGVEVGTEAMWSFVKKQNLPSAIIVNKIDNEHSKFDETVNMCKDRLSPDATIISFPLKEGTNSDTVIDIIIMSENDIKYL